jgi:cytochrome c oxidase assembly protein subunit 15
MAMAKTLIDVYEIEVFPFHASRKLLHFIFGLTFVQLIVSGLMAGMKAGLYFPSWPDMNGSFVPSVLKNRTYWAWENMQLYDSIPFAPSLVHFTHRTLAYVLVILTVLVFIKYRHKVTGMAKNVLHTMLLLVFVQVIFGILTVLNVNGKIPLFWGVIHQLTGLLYFLTLFFLVLVVKRIPQAESV